jgi:tRNA pseudouridine38-40 synthase
MAYRLILSYRGTRYSGWQRQPNAITVQEKLEEALSRVAGERVKVVAAGRTDRGVHAAGQAVSFLPGPRLPDLPARAWVHGTNRLLPEDIRVLAAEEVEAGFHARRDARGKEYRYRLRRCAVLSPLESLFVLQVDPALDLNAMRLASEALVGRHDFSAFALSGGVPGPPVRTVERVVWHEDGESLNFLIVGNGFLRGMVRSIVGTLLEVGLGRRSADGFPALLQDSSRGEAGRTAPAHGLTLERVFY